MPWQRTGRGPDPRHPLVQASTRATSITRPDQQPLFPLDPGTRFTYKGNDQKAPVVDIVTVTRNTPTINGVKTIEVSDQVWESDVLVEDLYTVK